MLDGIGFKKPKDGPNKMFLICSLKQIFLNKDGEKIAFLGPQLSHFRGINVHILMENNSIAYPESLLEVVHILWKWRRSIIGFVVTATLATAAGSLLMPNYYESKSIFYPANEEAFTRSGLFGNNPYNSDIGTDVMVERIITFATSRDLADHLIARFDLYNHYQIDSTKPRAQEKLLKRFLKLYKVEKNAYGAIELSVEDKDPEYPLPMVQEAMRKVDELYQKAISANRQRTIEAYEKTLFERYTMQTTVIDSLAKLRKMYGIFNIQSQGEVYSGLVLSTEADLAQAQAGLESLMSDPLVPADTIAYVRARVKGLEKKLSNLTSPDPNAEYSARRFNEGRDKVLELEMRQYNLSEEIKELTEKYSQFKTANILQPSVIIEAERAQKPRSKSRPSRSIFVVGAFLISLFVGIGGAVLIESTRNVRWKEVLSDK
jgi:capsule polysaccharide export protein KpsE/RkpR